MGSPAAQRDLSGSLAQISAESTYLVFVSAYRGNIRAVWMNQSPRLTLPDSTIFKDSPPSLICGDKFLNGAYGGCSIGGSSAINAGLYFEPPASDWDDFHPDGWKSTDVDSAIQRLYARQPTVTVTSKDGRLYAQTGYEVAKKWLVDGAGYSEVSFNEEADNKHSVFGHTLYDYQNGQRGGPVTTYLQSALVRSNFLLKSNVTVLRAVREGSKATGVFATVDGVDKTINLTSTGRVIFSGGAIFSPSLLMHSGIGPSDVLTQLSEGGALDPNLSPSAWINNTAVGAGLFDNPNTFIEMSAPAIESYTYTYTNMPSSDEELYINNRSGPLASAGQTSAFWTYINHTDGSLPTGVQGTIGTAGAYDFQSNSTVTLNVYGTSGLLSTCRVINTRSSTAGKFLPGPGGGCYYSDAAGRDADDVSQFVFDIFSALDKSGSGLEPLNIARNATKEDIKKYITTPSQYAMGAVNHWSSSCRIGACVDAETRVIGMDNLHVVDASILAPLTVNPQFGVMVAAERGADLIVAMG